MKTLKWMVGKNRAMLEAGKLAKSVNGEMRTIQKWKKKKFHKGPS